MKDKKLINSLNSQVDKVTQIIEKDISELGFCAEEERLKTQKCLIDNLHKLTNILLQIKKLEKSGCDEEIDDDPEADKKILMEYFKRVNW